MSPVRMRLARLGGRHAPFYRIHVADSRAPRDGKHVEVVGTYDPLPRADGNKHVTLDMERIQYWLGVGVQPTGTVKKILAQVRRRHPFPSRICDACSTLYMKDGLREGHPRGSRREWGWAETHSAPDLIVVAATP